MEGKFKALIFNFFEKRWREEGFAWVFFIIF
jgi:hypothetical protein